MSISNASVYKWIDNAGQANYSDFPPNSASDRVMATFLPNRNPEKCGLRQSEKAILKKIEQEYQMAIRASGRGLAIPANHYETMIKEIFDERFCTRTCPLRAIIAIRDSSSRRKLQTRIWVGNDRF